MGSVPEKSELEVAKSKLGLFRVKELTDILDRFHLKKGGRKADLVKRIEQYIDSVISELAHQANPAQVRELLEVLQAAYRNFTGGAVLGGPALYAPAPAPPPAGAPHIHPAAGRVGPGPAAHGNAHVAPPPPGIIAPPPPPLGRVPQQLPIPTINKPSQNRPALPPHPAAGMHSQHHAAGASTVASGARAQHGQQPPGYRTNSSSQPHRTVAGTADIATAFMNGMSSGRQGGTASAYANGPSSNIPGVGASTPPYTGAAGARSAKSPDFKNATVRCLCGSPSTAKELVQCKWCKVVQHADCVALPPLAQGQRRTSEHHCERCRAERCDPFWQPVESTILPPAKLVPTGKSGMVGTKMEAVQTLERQISVTAQQFDWFRRQSDRYRLQVVCLQLNDSVPFRFHWPTQCELRVNNTQYRVYARAASQKMGANARDEPANISVLIPSTRTARLVVTAIDSATYVVLVQVAKQRSTQEVKAMMLQPESLEAAASRVKKQMGGGGDDDLEVLSSRVSLRCPLSGARIGTPARFTDVPGMSCFDLDSFMSMAEKNRKWQCPHSMKNSSVYNLQVDTYVSNVLSALAKCPDITEVEINPEGLWRPVPVSGKVDESLPWHKIGQQPYPNGIQAHAAPYIKPDPAAGDDSDEESLNESEELRQAAAAMKRGREKADPEIIDLLDSDDDGATSQPAKKRNTGQSTQGTAAQAAAGARPPASTSAPAIPPMPPVQSLRAAGPSTGAAAAHRDHAHGTLQGPQGATLTAAGRSAAAGPSGKFQHSQPHTHPTSVAAPPPPSLGQSSRPSGSQQAPPPPPLAPPPPSAAGRAAGNHTAGIQSYMNGGSRQASQPSGSVPNGTAVARTGPSSSGAGGSGSASRGLRPNTASKPRVEVVELSDSD